MALYLSKYILNGLVIELKGYNVLAQITVTWLEKVCASLDGLWRKINIF